SDRELRKPITGVRGSSKKAILALFQSTDCRWRSFSGVAVRARVRATKTPRSQLLLHVEAVAQDVDFVDGKWRQTPAVGGDDGVGGRREVVVYGLLPVAQGGEYGGQLAFVEFDLRHWAPSHQPLRYFHNPSNLRPDTRV